MVVFFLNILSVKYCHALLIDDAPPTTTITVNKNSIKLSENGKNENELFEMNEALTITFSTWFGWVWAWNNEYTGMLKYQIVISHQIHITCKHFHLHIVIYQHKTIVKLFTQDNNKSEFWCLRTVPFTSELVIMNINTQTHTISLQELPYNWQSTWQSLASFGLSFGKFSELLFNVRCVWSKITIARFLCYAWCLDFPNRKYFAGHLFRNVYLIWTIKSPNHIMSDFFFHRTIAPLAHKRITGDSNDLEYDKNISRTPAKKHYVAH